MYRAVRAVFDKAIRVMGKTHCINFIYQYTAKESAPCFYLTYKEARRIIHAHEAGKLRYRAREIITKRDRDFVEAYRRFMLSHRGCLKSWAILEVIASPAPQFYIDYRMVASIVSGRDNRI